MIPYLELIDSAIDINSKHYKGFIELNYDILKYDPIRCFPSISENFIFSNDSLEQLTFKLLKIRADDLISS